MSDLQQDVVSPSERLRIQRERLKKFFVTIPLQHDEGLDEEDDDDDDDYDKGKGGDVDENDNYECENDEDDDDGDDESNEIRLNHLMTTTTAATKQDTSVDLFENGHILASFNPTKLKPLEPLDISTRFASFKMDAAKSPRAQQLADLQMEQHLRRRLEFELDELKKKIDVQYKPRIEALTAEIQKKDKLYADQLKEYRNKVGLQKSNFDEIEKVKLESQIAEYKEKLNKKIEEVKALEDLVKPLKINNRWYETMNVIGKGGFSEVLHCVSFKEKISYAVKKVNLSSIDVESVKLMMNEIDLLKKLKNVDKCIQIFDYELDKSKNFLYVVMELGSTDLSKYFKAEIQKNKCVKEPERVFYWLKMLEAVQAIHRVGIVHNDIKPGNFVLVGCEIKLIDFNISNSMNDRTSITLTFDCGTLSYMAPETIKNDKKKINQKVDVWSLGVILYLMTYGKLPFQHLKRPEQVMFAICDQSRCELNIPQIDNKDLYDVIDKCLRYNQNERYSVDELLSHPYIISNFR